MWPCGNLVYLVYRFVTCLFIAEESLQLHHISEEKALPPGSSGIPGYPGIPGLTSNPDPEIFENKIPGFFGIFI